MTRTEALGWSVAVAAHAALIAALSWQAAIAPLPSQEPAPLNVDLIGETAAVSTAPELSDTAPAPRQGDPEPTPSEPAPPLPSQHPTEAEKATPQLKPQPTQQPAAKAMTARPEAPAPRTTPQPPRATTQPAIPRPTGALKGIADSVSRTPSNSASRGAPAAAVGAEVKRSIAVSINGAVRGPWNRCQVSGADVGSLVTVVRFRLTQAGALERITSVATSGQTDSNRFQVTRHQECATRAIELAAPFDLPPEAYTVWRDYELEFFKR